jgi:hypothetical protein
MEIELDRDTGEIDVRRAVAAVDAGQPAHPEGFIQPAIPVVRGRVGIHADGDREIFLPQKGYGCVAPDESGDRSRVSRIKGRGDFDRICSSEMNAALLWCVAYDRP